MFDQAQYAKLVKSRFSGLQSEQAKYLPMWKDIRDYLSPRSARFSGEIVNDGSRKDLKIINTSPRYSVRALPAGMQSGVTSPMRPWFRLGIPDTSLQEHKPVKEWLFEVERIMREAMSRSNIYDRLKSNYGTLGLYGTSCLYIDEDDDDIIRAHDFAFGTFYIAGSASGRINTVYREVVMTALQMVERFGKDKCPTTIQNAYDQGNYETTHNIVHIIEPNRQYSKNSAITQFKKFASVWLDPSAPPEKAILKYAGYDYLPALVPRWDLVGEDHYGVGCGEFALGDSKQLQLMEKRALQILDKKEDPAMVADASLKNQRKSSVPGSTTYVNGLIQGRSGYAPAYQIDNPYLDQIDMRAQRIEQRIDEAFYKNLFLLVTQIADQPNITATQINTMREEKLMMLGPVLERLNDELLDPMIDIVFQIQQRRGLLPEPPPEIMGMPLRVEYISVLAQAQKAMGIGNIERFVGFIGNMAQFDPSAWAKLNVNETIDEYADGTAIPPRLVRTTKEADEITQGQKQQSAMAAASEMIPKAAQGVKALGDTDLDGDSVLTRAMETAGMQ